MSRCNTTTVKCAEKRRWSEAHFIKMRACWGWDAQSSPYSVPPSASERGSRISLLVLTSPRIAGGFCPCGPALSALVHRELPEAQIATPTPPRPASRSRERLAAEAGEAREFACCPTRLLRAPPHPDTRYAKKVCEIIIHSTAHRRGEATRLASSGERMRGRK